MMEQANRKGNITGEFTTGDEGIAYAAREDETGRVWWFVEMRDGRNRNMETCTAVDEMDRPVGVYGWMSSRFVDVIK